MTPAAAAWIRETVLVQSAPSYGPRAGGPCPCDARQPCASCQVGSHDSCTGHLVDREKGVYGPGLAWPPRARVRTAGPECRARCTCRSCYPPPPPQQLGLFG
ncbi:hypothetical protein [Streptomyces sp. W1SF4]|uniref:hypothetical protein n=1 Tax=Streptomyces sp. W1SF4 TaxID=2305220 RepID=UPI000F6BA860|nr:hypothetical protein [Streptomyces sp. W1SF4]AZM91462.1 hypothetical protein D1J60_25750 [Streptomyces sp. W1SF4]